MAAIGIACVAMCAGVAIVNKVFGLAGFRHAVEKKTRARVYIQPCSSGSGGSKVSALPRRDSFHSEALLGCRLLWLRVRCNLV
jgi:hypothetical protein